jgi:peptide-methionine (R)-S-oxide reductase
MEKVIKTDDEWRQILSEEQFRVTRKHDTEPAFSGALYDKHEAGTYHCICCGAALFDSQTKFESGSGWPSFYAPMDHAPIEETEDNSFFMRRIAARVMRILGMCFQMGRNRPAYAIALIQPHLIFSVKINPR